MQSSAPPSLSWCGKASVSPRLLQTRQHILSPRDLTFDGLQFGIRSTIINRFVQKRVPAPQTLLQHSDTRLRRKRPMSATCEWATTRRGLPSSGRRTLRGRVRWRTHQQRAGHAGHCSNNIHRVCCRHGLILPRRRQKAGRMRCCRGMSQVVCWGASRRLRVRLRGRRCRRRRRSQCRSDALFRFRFRL